MPKEWFVMYSSRRWCGKRPSQWLPMGTCRYRILTDHWYVVISVKPFRGAFVVEKRRAAWCRTGQPHELLEARERPSVKKVKLADRSAVSRLAAQDTEYFADHGAIVDALSLLQYDDGSPRQPGYLGVWTQGSTWVVRITDKDADAQLTCEGRTLDEALDTLALHLGSDKAPWEPVSRRKKKGG